MTQMTEKQKELVDSYGIQCAQKTVYLYKQFRYDNLEDALRYAEIDTSQDRNGLLPRSGQG
jgi:hypothetical protein